MRVAKVLLTLSLLLGAAPALAQESPGIIPTPPQPEVAPAAKPVQSKAAAPAPKSANSKEALPTLAPKSADSKPAEVKTATPAPAPPKAEPAPDTFAGIPHGERQKIQAALLWSGDYTGAVGGEDPMLTAIKNYQKRSKAKVTGTLTSEERANLIAAAKLHEDEFGWNVVVDPATGVRIGLPTKMVPHTREAARGTRWSSAQGQVQVETFRIA